MAHGASCPGAAQARAWSIRILRHMVKPGRLGKAAREKAGLERKKCRGKAKWEDKDAQHALADEVIEEEQEVGAAENAEEMDFEGENLVDKMVAEAERRAELALEEAEMAAAEAESYEMELETLLKELGV
ncbi:TY5A [Symbiodinium sp. CCMP2592]|nr:TY5A [Symbiodinium sp. CCMP2592]